MSIDTLLIPIVIGTSIESVIKAMVRLHRAIQKGKASYKLSYEVALHCLKAIRYRYEAINLFYRT